MSNITIYKQIYPNQCARLKTLGYASIINGRPDGEAQTQPDSDVMSSACAQTDLAYAYVPFSQSDEQGSTRLSKATVRQFAAAYHALPKPILMYCGTGSRAKLLYQSACMEALI